MEIRFLTQRTMGSSIIIRKVADFMVLLQTLCNHLYRGLQIKLVVSCKMQMQSFYFACKPTTNFQSTVASSGANHSCMTTV